MTFQSGPPTSPLPQVPGIDLLGVHVSAVNMQSATRQIEDAIRQKRRGYVCLCGAHGLVESQSIPALRQAYCNAFLVTPDGMPLVWELRRQGHADAGRVYGPDLMLELFGRGYRHFLYGSSPKTLARLTKRLEARFPGAHIVGVFSPPFRSLTEREDKDVASRINATEPDIVWVGLGAPKQELWMARMRDQIQAPMLIGVGAAFDFHAGQKRQAPSFVQSCGLEWLFRLLTEPRRLWRRYFKVVPGYLALLALQRSGVRQFPPARLADASGNPVRNKEQ